MTTAMADDDNGDGGRQQQQTTTAAVDNVTRDQVADYKGEGEEWGANNNGVKCYS
jgi:hypothetical protein